MKGTLNDKEWQEIVTLEYVLTWKFSDNLDEDILRYKQLNAKRCVLSPTPPEQP